MYLIDTNIWLELVGDTLEENSVNKISLESDELRRISSIQKQYALDFDDAYQYVAASENSLTLVSFDSDFDKTPLGRKTPSEIS